MTQLAVLLDDVTHHQSHSIYLNGSLYQELG